MRTESHDVAPPPSRAFNILCYCNANPNVYNILVYSIRTTTPVDGPTNSRDGHLYRTDGINFYLAFLGTRTFTGNIYEITYIFFTYIMCVLLYMY